MRSPTENYSVWREIHYQPAIAEILPVTLLGQLSSGNSILEIGCNSGAVSRFLAKKGFQVVGIDINRESIDIAKKIAIEEGVANRTKFIYGNILEEKQIDSFDAVLMVRVLTCFPDLDDWQSLLERSASLLNDGGILYINDFVYVENSPVYKNRYQEGIRLGWRKGNFPVYDKAGDLQFIAHHHTKGEIEQIISPYQILNLNFRNSISMNGNECEMFEFVGRKRPNFGQSRFGNNGGEKC